jgi:hypothetical protein
LEGNALKPKELEKLIEDAESLLVITEKGKHVTLSYSENLSEMEVLDILALVTSSYYNVANEDDNI